MTVDECIQKYCERRKRRGCHDIINLRIANEEQSTAKGPSLRNSHPGTAPCLTLHLSILVRSRPYPAPLQSYNQAIHLILCLFFLPVDSKCTREVEERERSNGTVVITWHYKIDSPENIMSYLPFCSKLLEHNRSQCLRRRMPAGRHS